MATRQYIGARYVPKFYQNSVDGSANWQSNVVYDPLTYVTLTNGHMYISKKQVPATVGTPASNAEYWLDVGSYNGFIDELQAEIDNINNISIPAINTDIINLKNYAIPFLLNKRVVVYGDSTAALNNSYINQLAATNICTTLVNRAVSGTLMNEGNNNGRVLIRDSTDLTNFDTIILCYGTNEWLANISENALMFDVNAILSTIATKNPAINIVFILPPYSYHNFDNDVPNLNGAGMFLKDVNNVIVDGCKQHKVATINLYELSNCNEYNYTNKLDPSYSDPHTYVHPNTAFAKEIMGILINGTHDDNQKYYATPILCSYDFYKEQTAIPSEILSGIYQTDLILKLTAGTPAYSTKKTVRGIYKYRAKGRATVPFTISIGDFSRNVSAGLFDFEFVVTTTIAPFTLSASSDGYIANFNIYAMCERYPVDRQNTRDNHGRAIRLEPTAYINMGGVPLQYLYGENEIVFPYGTAVCTQEVPAGTVIAHFDSYFPKEITIPYIQGVGGARTFSFYVANGNLISRDALEDTRVIEIIGTFGINFNNKSF